MMLTIPQMIMLAIILAVLVFTKNLVNRPAILVVTAITLLHMYDHLFLIKRGKERKLVENYCAACKGA